MSQEQLQAITIECPHCSKENNFDINAAVKCEHCKKEITGFRYSKEVKSSLSGFIVGACIIAGGHIAADHIFEKNRYPISTEYSIIENCISSYNRPLTTRQFSEKRKVCQQVLTETQEEFDYKKFEEDQNGFLSKFESIALRY